MLRKALQQQVHLLDGLLRRTSTSTSTSRSYSSSYSSSTTQQRSFFSTPSYSNSNSNNNSVSVRDLSTSAALLASDSDDDEDVVNDNDNDNVVTSTQSTSTQRQRQKPRLEALRKQLNGEDPTVIKKIMKQQQQSQSASSNSNSNSNSKRQRSPQIPQQDATDADWIKQLEALPDPPQLQQLLQQQSQAQQSHTLQPQQLHNPAVLQDTFGRQHSYLRISLSEKCNLRCLYCMPEDGVPLQPKDHLLSNEEIISLVDWFVTVGGVDKIRFTGGEPMLRKDIVDLIQTVHDKHPSIHHIGMTTNGVTLAKQLPQLIDAGLTHVNISLDSLDATKFSKFTRRPESYFHRVMDAIEACSNNPHIHTKINCVVLPENVQELPDFAALSLQSNIDIRFIEYMPFNDNQWGTSDFVSYQDMQQVFADSHANTGYSLQRLQDGPNDTTKWWTYTDNDSDSDNHNQLQQQQQQGRIGFITSMSSHFCDTCNRLRLTTDGQLKVCLFGATEVSLRDVLRANRPDLIAKVVHAAVQRKHYKLGGHKDMQDISDHSDENRPMTLIGG